MTQANDPVLVPKHYRSEYIHWDLIIATGADYLVGNATKYISRWRKKGGLQDLQKALHYVNKLSEAVAAGLVQSRITSKEYSGAFAEVSKFSLVNGLSEREQVAVTDLILWKDEGDLESARDMILLLMDEAEPKPVPAEDSNRHAERVKCLVSEGGAVDFGGNTIEDCRYPNCDCERLAPDPTGW